MSLRGLVVSAVLLAACVLAWQKREGLQSWLRQAQSGAAAGARAATDAVQSTAPTTTPQPAPGGLRKCVKGQQVTYTNAECPPGHREQAVAGDVTVLPAPPVSKPAEEASAPSQLHQALGLTPDEKLRQKIMDRATDGTR